MRSINGNALRFVDSRGVTVIDMRIALGVKATLRPSSSFTDMLRRDLFDLAKTAILDAKARGRCAET